MSHANAALTPRTRLRLAHLIVDDGWAYARGHTSETGRREALPGLDPLLQSPQVPFRNRSPTHHQAPDNLTEHHTRTSHLDAPGHPVGSSASTWTIENLRMGCVLRQGSCCTTYTVSGGACRMSPALAWGR